MRPKFPFKADESFNLRRVIRGMSGHIVAEQFNAIDGTPASLSFYLDMKRMEPSTEYGFYFISDPDNKFLEDTCLPSEDAVNMKDGVAWDTDATNTEAVITFTTDDTGNYFGKESEELPFVVTALPAEPAENRVDVNRSVFVIGHPSAEDVTKMRIVGCAYLSVSNTNASRHIVKRKWPLDVEDPPTV